MLVGKRTLPCCTNSFNGQVKFISASKLKFDKENISKFKILKDDIGHGSIRGNAVQSGNSTKSSSVDFNDELIGGIVPAKIKAIFRVLFMQLKID